MADCTRFHLLLLLQTSEDFQGNRATLSYFKGIIAVRDAKSIGNALRRRCLKDEVHHFNKSNEEESSCSFSKEERTSYQGPGHTKDKVIASHNFDKRRLAFNKTLHQTTASATYRLSIQARTPCAWRSVMRPRRST